MDADLPPLSPFQTFTTERVARSALKGAPYNPRRALTPDEKKKLKTLLKKHGLVNAPVWNRRTGTLVGGHQRLSILDSLHDDANYSLDVNVVDVDETQERELNVALNNQLAASDYDLDKLGALFQDGNFKLDLDGTGFDAPDLYRMFGESPFQERPEELTQMADNIRAFGEQVSAPARKTEEAYSQDFYTVVVWRDVAARDAGHAALGFDDNRFQDGRALLALLKGAKPDGETQEE